MCKMLLAKFVASRHPDAVPDASGALEEGWKAAPDAKQGGSGPWLAHEASSRPDASPEKKEANAQAES